MASNSISTNILAGSLFGSGYDNWISNIQATLGPVAMIFLIIAIALLGGFMITRLCKLLKIPYVTGYIILGILLGPSLLSFIPTTTLSGDQSVYAGMSFISDMTMGFIAFGCGRFFKWKNIKDAGYKVILVSALSALTIGIITGALSYLIYGLAFNKANEYGIAPALIIGACAACISPTATSSIIRQYKAKGPFVERVFQNILVANIVAILSFSIILGLVSSGALGGNVTKEPYIIPVYEAFKPLISNLLFCLVGFLFAIILGKLNNYRRTNDSRIILTIAFIIALVAISSIDYEKINYYLPFSKISPLLPCMAFGIAYYNLSKSESLFIQLENFLPPILCLFFVISGAKLQLANFADAAIAVMAILFVIFRTGAQFGSLYTFGKCFKCQSGTKCYLTMTMFTMTSVAVGLINLAVTVISPTNPMINYVYTVILTGCVILEIVGPVFAKIALIKTNSADPAVLLTLADPKAARNAQISNTTSD